MANEKTENEQMKQILEAEDFYAVLGVKKDEKDDEQYKKQYETLLAQVDPNKNKNNTDEANKAQAKLKEAYAALKSEQDRVQYNKLLAKKADTANEPKTPKPEKQSGGFMRRMQSIVDHTEKDESLPFLVQFAMQLLSRRDANAQLAIALLSNGLSGIKNGLKKLFNKSDKTSEKKVDDKIVNPSVGTNKSDNTPANPNGSFRLSTAAPSKPKPRFSFLGDSNSTDVKSLNKGEDDSKDKDKDKVVPDIKNDVKEDVNSTDERKNQLSS